MADRVVQIAMSEGELIALTESGRILERRWTEKGGYHWEESARLPGCEPVQDEDPWRDLTDEEESAVVQIVATEEDGAILHDWVIPAVVRGIRKVRGGGQ